MANADAAKSSFDLIVGVHDLADPPDAMDDELQSWLSFEQARPLLDTILENTRRNGVRLHITSDDGFRSDYEILMPWLIDNGVDGTFFIVTDFLDRPGRLTTPQLREIATSGIRIGVHGVGHLNWTKLSHMDFIADVQVGRDRLEQVLGTSVDLVAPPFDAYNLRIICQLFDMGFREVHTCRSGLSLRRAPVKPRNMLKQSQIDAVLATSTTTGTLGDAIHCWARRLCFRKPNLRWTG